jgi:IclR family acetate operon transcriptional repressor
VSRTGQPAVRHVAAVERAFAVLDALADSGFELGTNEIARRTGINASTVSRLLATLAQAGFVERVAESGRYRLGLRLLQLGNAVLARLDLREVARPHLVALADETGETATLSAPDEHDAVTVDYAQSGASTVQYVARVGRPSVGHATAVGKVLLAFGGNFPRGPLTSFTDRTITDLDLLAAEVAAVRARGWARAVGEREPGLNAVAAPVLASRGELAAIFGIQGPSARFDAIAMEEALPRLLDHAGQVSAALGWNQSQEDR